MELPKNTHYDERLLLRASDQDKRSRRLRRDLRGSQGNFVSAVSTAFNKSLHAELVEACSAVFQQPAEFGSKFSGDDECGGHVDFENTR
jgi:hypothetical protein